MFQNMVNPVSGSGGGGLTPSAIDYTTSTANSGTMGNVEPNAVICMGGYYFYYLGYIENGVLTTVSNGDGVHGYVDSYDESTKTITWRKSDTRADHIRVINYT